MATRAIYVKLGVQDAAAATAALRAFGTDGAAALHKIEEATRRPTDGLRNLDGAVRGVRDGLGAIYGPLGGVAGRFGELARAAGDFGAAGLALGGIMVGVTAAIIKGTLAAAELERQQGRVEALLRATASASGLTAEEIEGLADAISKTSLATKKDLTDAAGVILTFKQISGDAFGRTLRLAADLAEVMGTDVRSAAVQLAKALEDPERNLAQLNRSGISFSQAQIALIKHLDDTGQHAKAMSLILDVIEGQLGGAAAGAAGGLIGQFHRLGEEIGDLFETIGNSTALKAMTATLSLLADVLHKVNEQASAAADPVARVVAAMQAGGGTATAGGFGSFGTPTGGNLLSNFIGKHVFGDTGAANVAATQLDAGVALNQLNQKLVAALGQYNAASQAAIDKAAGDALKVAEKAEKERVTLHKQAVSEIERLEDQAATAGLDGLEKIKAAQDVELKHYQELLDKKIIVQEEFERARAAVIDKYSKEEDKFRADRAKKDQDDQRRELEQQAKKQAELLQRPFLNALDGLQSAFTDAFESIFDPESKATLAERTAAAIKQVFIRLAAELAALMVIRPVLGGIVDLTGLGGASAASAFGGGTAGSPAAAGGGAGILDSIIGLGRSVVGGGAGGFLGITDLIDSAGTFLGLSGGLSSLPTGVAAADFGAAGLTGGASASLGVSGVTLSSILGAAGIGAGVGGLLNAFGVGKTSLGTTLGGAIGGIAGSFIPVPVVGTLVGSVIGSLIGGLFGNNRPSVGPNASGNARFVNGVFQFTGGGADNGGDIGGIAAVLRNVSTAVNQIIGTLGATVVHGANDAEIGFTNFPSQGGLSGLAFGAGGRGRQSFSDVGQAQEFLTIAALQSAARSGLITGVSDAVVTAIKNSVATKLQDFASDIDFAQNLDAISAGLTQAANELDRIKDSAKASVIAQESAIKSFQDRAQALGLATQGAAAVQSAIDSLIDFTESDDTLTQTQRALAAIEGNAAGLVQVLNDLGLATQSNLDKVAAAAQQQKDALRDSINDATEQAILQITDPAAAALAAFDKQADQRLREAEAAGADLVAVEKLTALQRQQVIEQASAATVSDLRRLYDTLTASTSSGLPPAEALANARAAYQAAAAQYGATGSTAGLADAVNNFLALDRQVNATGGTFGADYSGAIALLQQVLGLPAHAEGGVAGGGLGPAIYGEASGYEAAVPLARGRFIPVQFTAANDSGGWGAKLDQLIQYTARGTAVIEADIGAMRRDIRALRADLAQFVSRADRLLSLRQPDAA